ncbi:MAG: NDP-sugar synthase [Euryarchaeota archaeon]|jgi:mannose-1-phosphate guanylyltransferase|nr:NDP-sugar synthase [Euryarchaeota archaeon]MBT4407401.1 NDP-sugar synthase [Euryarchaeota archaeon]MBT6645498.1 NDP-sugar synthase [Euryarchaeota archaeon]
MDVIVLAGGFGTRLRPWTKHHPKPLLPILDRTMIEHVVSILPEKMVGKVIIAAGFGIEQMRNHFENVDLSYEVVIVEEFEPLGTGGAIANCRDYLSGGTFCVINGDLLTSLSVEDMLQNHQAKGGLGSISLWQVEDPSRFGVADFSEDSGVIRRFQEKPKREDAFSNLINAGTYLLEPEVFDLMPEGAFSMERIVFPEMAEAGQLFGFPFEGHFVDAGTPESYIIAAKTVISYGGWVNGGSVPNVEQCWAEDVEDAVANISTSAVIANSAFATGISIGENVEVKDTACLHDVRIGDDAKVSGCMIAARTSVGAGAKLENVVIDYDSIIPENHSQSGGKWPQDE